MGRIDDVGDEVEDMSADAQNILDDLVDTTQDQADMIDQLQENLVYLSFGEVHQLYSNEDIPQSAAREFEQHVDAQLKGAGYEPHFERLPDGERPSEMYKDDRFWTTRRVFGAGILSVLGIGTLASDAGNYAEEDTPDEGGLRLPFGSGDLDAWGALENQAATDGSSETPGYQVMEGTIDREAYREIFPRIVESDRRVAQEIMGPDAFDRYFDGEATEFAEMNVNYDPDPKADNSSIEIGLVQADSVEDLSNISEEEISYGLDHVSDRAARTLIQELEAYQNQEGY